MHTINLSEQVSTVDQATACPSYNPKQPSDSRVVRLYEEGRPSARQTTNPSTLRERFRWPIQAAYK